MNLKLNKDRKNKDRKKVDNEKALTIGKVSKLVGFSVDTIRYYEKIGLIPKPQRKESVWGHGYRQFSFDIINFLVLIRELKKIGFTLKEIREIIYFCNGNSSVCSKVVRKLENKLNQVRREIDHLIGIKEKIEKLIENCLKGGKRMGEDKNCQVVQELIKEGEEKIGLERLKEKLKKLKEKKGGDKLC